MERYLKEKLLKNNNIEIKFDTDVIHGDLDFISLRNEVIDNADWCNPSLLERKWVRSISNTQCIVVNYRTVSYIELSIQEIIHKLSNNRNIIDYLHRTDGPAFLEANENRKEWFLHGNCHRLGGPAIVSDYFKRDDDLFTKMGGVWYARNKNVTHTMKNWFLEHDINPINFDAAEEVLIKIQMSTL